MEQICALPLGVLGELLTRYSHLRETMIEAILATSAGNIQLAERVGKHRCEVYPLDCEDFTLPPLGWIELTMTYDEDTHVMTYAISGQWPGADAVLCDEAAVL